MARSRFNEAIDIAWALMEPLDNEYHNVDHVVEVSNEARHLATEEGLSDHDEMLVRVAAWFHDVGYIYGPENHEEKGADIARVVLRSHGFTNREISEVTCAIEATEIPHPDRAPPVAACVADADVASLGYEYEEFKSFCETVRDEWEPEWSMKKWYSNYTVNLLEATDFITETAQDKYQDQKEENLRKLREEFNIDE